MIAKKEAIHPTMQHWMKRSLTKTLVGLPLRW